MEGKLQVLLLPELTEKYPERVLEHLPNEREKYIFHSIDPVPRRNDGLIDFTIVVPRAREIMREFDIRVLYYDDDSGALLAALLREEFPGLKGPKFEAVFLCQHKWYANTIIDGAANPASCIFSELDQLEENLKSERERILLEVGLPCVIKPCLGFASYSVRKCLTEDDVTKALQYHLTNRNVTADVMAILQQYEGLEGYPLARTEGVIAQEFYDGTAQQGTQYTMVVMDCCVVDGKITFWPPSEMVYLPYGESRHAHGFPAHQLPSKLSCNQQELIQEAFGKDVQNLIKHGFDYSFLHGEYFISDKGDVRLIELNPRVSHCMNDFYLRGLDNGDVLKGLIDIQLDKPLIPPSLKGTYCLLHWVWTSKVTRADKLLDFEKALMHPDINLTMKPDTEITPEVGSDGYQLAWIVVDGKDFSDCLRKIIKIRNDVLFNPKDCPWRIYIDSVKEGSVLSQV